MAKCATAMQWCALYFGEKQDTQSNNIGSNQNYWCVCVCVCNTIILHSIDTQFYTICLTQHIFHSAHSGTDIAKQCFC